MGYGIKYFSCCENVDNELNGDCVDDDNDIYNHCSSSDCRKHKLSKSADEVQDIIYKRFKSSFCSVILNRPYTVETYEQYIIENGLKERKNENIFKDGYLWKKLWNAVDYVAENDGNEKKMKTKKWKYSLNVIDNLMR